jgi:hypothetical protein
MKKTLIASLILINLISCQSSESNNKTPVELTTKNFQYIYDKAMEKGNKLDFLAAYKGNWVKLNIHISEISEKYNDFSTNGGWIYSKDAFIDDCKLSVYIPEPSQEVQRLIMQKRKSQEPFTVVGQINNLNVFSDFDSWDVEVLTSNELILENNSN